jgi:hypothetical protein
VEKNLGQSPKYEVNVAPSALSKAVVWCYKAANQERPLTDVLFLSESMLFTSRPAPDLIK